MAVAAVAAASSPGNALPRLGRTSFVLTSSDLQALKGARLGSLHELYENRGIDARVLDVFNSAIGELGNLGATIIEQPAVNAPRADAASSSQPALGMTSDRLLRLMSELELDALVCPTSSAVPPGFPVAVVPGGTTRDRSSRPGVQFVGRPTDEQTALRLAYSYEQATNHRRPPQLR